MYMSPIKKNLNIHRPLIYLWLLEKFHRWHFLNLQEMYAIDIHDTKNVQNTKNVPHVVKESP